MAMGHTCAHPCDDAAPACVGCGCGCVGCGWGPSNQCGQWPVGVGGGGREFCGFGSGYLEDLVSGGLGGAAREQGEAGIDGSRGARGWICTTCTSSNSE